MLPFLLVLAALAMLWAIAHLALRTSPLQEPIMISHRGAAALAPENTLAGVQRALEEGAGFIEVDVQRSADGVLVILHDRTVGRTTDGAGDVGKLMWDQLRTLDAGSWFGPAFTGEPVPSLDQVLALMSSGDWTLVLEGKSPARYPGIGEQIAEALQRHGVEDRTVIVSFDHPWLERMQRRLPGVPQSRLSVWASPWAARPPAQSESVFWPSPLLDPTLVWRLHRRGEQVRIWTVNHVGLMRLLLWLGVDAITTDHPERWAQAIGKD